jgi:hypothetical protein
MEITQEFSRKLGLVAFEALLAELKKAGEEGLILATQKEIVAMHMTAGLTFLEQIILLTETADIPSAVMAKEFVTGLLVCYGQKSPNGTQH